MEENAVENIRVAVRCRPMNAREIKEQSTSCFQCSDGNAVLTGDKEHSYENILCIEMIFH